MYNQHTPMKIVVVHLSLERTRLLAFYVMCKMPEVFFY